MRTMRLPAFRGELEICSEQPIKVVPASVARLWTRLVNGHLHSVRDDILDTRPLSESNEA